ncbi:hypothetical protein [Gluconobacter albidus]|uniref:hypothetical protein n=1 Tax=Gluconobacter albidus TaxID=318683 RepID=UPI0011EA5A6D|nr:hypothetical protein [Gluconobacter albidus]
MNTGEDHSNPEASNSDPHQDGRTPERDIIARFYNSAATFAENADPEREENITERQNQMSHEICVLWWSRVGVIVSGIAALISAIVLGLTYWQSSIAQMAALDSHKALVDVQRAYLNEKSITINHLPNGRYLADVTLTNEGATSARNVKLYGASGNWTVDKDDYNKTLSEVFPVRQGSISPKGTKQFRFQFENESVGPNGFATFSHSGPNQRYLIYYVSYDDIFGVHQNLEACYTLNPPQTHEAIPETQVFNGSACPVHNCDESGCKPGFLRNF